MTRGRLVLGLLSGMLLVFSGTAMATTITVSTAPGATENTGKPVSATATFVLTDGSIVITLTNTFVNPIAVAQNLSDLAFTLNTDLAPGGASLASSSGEAISITSKTVLPTSLGTVDTGWGLSQPSSSGILLNVLGTAIGPAHTIIGSPSASGLYSVANGSIAGNGPHNPFLSGPVTFNISVPGLAAGTQITSVTFSFNTTAGDNVTGLVPPPSVPEPASLILLGSGLLGLAAYARKRSGH